MIKRYLSLLALAGLFPITLSAATLQEIYELAVQNDPELAAAQASFKAQSEFITQSRAAFLPSVSMGGSTSNSRSRVLIPEDRPWNQYNSHNWNLSLQQPLFRMESWFLFRQAKNVEAQAMAQLAADQQALILRVAESYLAILEAQAALISSNAERNAVKRQLEQVQQRFDVGLVAITDVLESRAAFDTSTVSVIESEAAQNISFEALLRLTGQPITTISSLIDEIPIENPEPDNVEDWIQKAVSQNYALIVSREGLRIAEKDVKIARSGHYPSINSSISWGHNATGGGNSFFGSKSDSYSMSVNINIPLYSGGAVNSRARRSGFLLEQAQQNFDLQQRTIVENTRTLFTAIITDVARVRARLRGMESSQSALNATQTGYEVGTRNIVDVLLAQRQLYLSQFQYASARYQYIRNNLRLKQTVGSLSPDDIQAINRFIDVSTVERVIPTTR